MTTQSVLYRSCKKIDCCVELPAPVFLCVPPEIVAAHACPAEGDQPYEYSYIEATLTKETCVSAYGCVKAHYDYWFSYDDAQLIEGAVLTGTSITGIVCDNCYTQLIRDFAGNEVEVITDEYYGGQSLVTQHGCVYPLAAGYPLEVEDTDTIDLTINDAPPQTLSADLNISETVDNMIELEPDGVYVDACGDYGNRAAIYESNSTNTTGDLSDKLDTITSAISSVTLNSSTPCRNFKVLLLMEFNVQMSIEFISDPGTITFTFFLESSIDGGAYASILPLSSVSRTYSGPMALFNTGWSWTIPYTVALASGGSQAVDTRIRIVHAESDQTVDVQLTECWVTTFGINVAV